MQALKQLSNGHICLKTNEPCCYANCTSFDRVATFIAAYRGCPARMQEPTEAVK